MVRTSVAFSYNGGVCCQKRSWCRPAPSTAGGTAVRLSDHQVNCDLQQYSYSKLLTFVSHRGWRRGRHRHLAGSIAARHSARQQWRPLLSSLCFRCCSPPQRVGCVRAGKLASSSARCASNALQGKFRATTDDVDSLQLFHR